MSSARAGRKRATLFLGIGFGVFVAVLAWLVVGSVTRRAAAVFPLTPLATLPTPFGVIDTVTLDARDPAQWGFFDFERGSDAGVHDGRPWDLGFRRFRIVTGGPVADVGRVSLLEAHRAADPQWTPTEFARDTVNAAVDRWYRYSLLSHLLRSSGHVYLLETAPGTVVAFEVLSYYCPGMAPGCLTLRYVRRSLPVHALAEGMRP